MRTADARTSILHRLAELEAELRSTRDQLKDLGTRDPLTAAVVTRGAQLACERSVLERRLEEIRLPRIPSAKLDD